MAYVDQQMSGNRITALIVVALIHIVLIYALVTGLAYEGYKKVVQRVTTIDIKDEVKKEPPPPPKKLDTPPPPIVAPPPPMQISVAPPLIQTVIIPPPPAPPPPPVLAPPAPAAPRITPKSPSPRGRPGDWANANDYPSRALREEKEGVTRFRVTVGADGRVTSCDVTGSSGTPELDAATCSLVTRRGRFNPATDGEGQPTAGGWASSVRWQIPKD